MPTATSRSTLSESKKIQVLRTLGKESRTNPIRERDMQAILSSVATFRELFLKNFTLNNESNYVLKKNVEFTDEIRQQISEVIKGAVSVAPQEMIQRHTVPGVLREAGIKWENYSLSGQAFSDWLALYFSEYEQDRMEDRNIYIWIPHTSVPVLPKPFDAVSSLPSEIHQRIVEILTPLMGSNGFILTATIPDQLEKGGILWQDYSESPLQKLTEWISKNLSEFTLFENNNRLKFNTDFLTTQNNNKQYPESIDPSSIESKQDVYDLHEFAFMWWPAIIKSLRTMTGYSGSNSDTWKAVIARRFAKARLLGRLLDAEEDVEPMMVFDTGIVTPTKKSVYLSLKRNPKYEVDKAVKQKWIFDELFYPGQPSKGIWLCSRFHIKSEEDGDIDIESIRREALDEASQLEALCEILPCICNDLTERSRLGQLISKDAIRKLDEYVALWESLCEKATLLHLTETPENGEPTVDSLKSSINNTTESLAKLEDSIRKFLQLMDETESLLSAAHLFRTPEGAETPISRDKRVLNEAYRRVVLEKGSHAVIDIFRNLLSAYRKLGLIMSSGVNQHNDDAITEAITDASTHFEMSPLRVSTVLLGSGELNILDSLNLLTSKLEEYARQANLSANDEAVGEEQLSRDFVNPSAILAFSSDIIKRSSVDKLIKKANPFEELIITSSIKEAAAMAENEAEMISVGYRVEELPLIRDVLARPMQSLRLSAYECAQRLFAVQGNANRQAEKFMMMASRTENSVGFLLSIYCAEQRTADFCYVYDLCCMDFDLSYENMTARLFAYYDKGEYASLLSFTKEAPELGYNRECLPLIIDAASSVGETELAVCMSNRLDSISSRFELNEFEKALIENNQENIKSIVGDPVQLSFLGYDEVTVDRIRFALSTGDYFQKKVDERSFETGERIFAIQGNFHGLAESFLWKGRLTHQRQHRCGIIMKLLVSEERWDECVTLYEAYKSDLENDKDCRFAYMKSLLKTDPASGVRFAKGHLLDCVETGLVGETTKIAEEYDESDFAQKLSLLNSSLSGDFERAVVWIRPELRDYILQPERLTQLDLPLRTIECFLATFKMDRYPHEQDALNTAIRVFELCGNYKKIAEQFAALALDEEKAHLLLCEIYDSEKRDRELSELYRLYSELVALTPEIYANMLYRSEQYELFLDFCVSDGLEKLREDMRIRILTARFAVGLFDEEQSESLASGAVWEKLTKDPDSLLHLMRIIAERGETLRLCYDRMLIKIFAECLHLFTEQDAANLATAFGSASEARLEQAQRDAFAENEACPFAIYCYTALHIGDYKALTDTSFQEMQQKIMNSSLPAANILLKTAETLYPAHREQIHTIAIKMRFGAVLKSGDSNDKKADSIARMLHEINPDKVGLELAINELEGSLAIIKAPLYEVLYVLGTRLSARAEVVDLLIKAYLNNTQDDFVRPFEDFIIRAASELVTEESLEADLLGGIECVCLNVLQKRRSASTAYCLYRVSQARNQENLANVTLMFLIRLQSENQGNQVFDKISAQERDSAETLSLFGLFLNELKSVGGREFLLFCERCGLLTDVSEKDVNFGQSLKISGSFGIAEDTLSNDESESLVRLLFIEPNNAVYWRAVSRMPFQEDIQGYQRALFLSAERNPSMWGTCTRYCSDKGLFLPMIDASIHWLAYACEGPYRLVDCHRFLYDLAEKIQLDNVFSNDPKLDDLVTALCDSFKQSEFKHETMRTICMVAVSFGREKYVIGRMSNELNKEHPNVGSFMVAKMLLAGHYEQAEELIQTLVNCGGVFAFRPFIAELSKLTSVELRNVVDDPLTVQILRFMLPHGNQPSFEAYRDYVIKYMIKGDLPSCARVFARLQTYFKNDGALYANLLLSCKDHFEGRETILYICLKGLCMYNSNPYVTQIRNNKLVLPKLLSMMSCVMVTRALTDNTKESEWESIRHVAQENFKEYADNISELRDFYESCFQRVENRDTTEQNLACDAMISCVAGNWTALLEQVYAQSEGFGVIKVNLEVSSVGFARSFLTVYLRQPEPSRAAFLEWLKEKVTYDLSEYIKVHLEEKDRSKIEVLSKLLKNIDPISAYLETQEAETIAMLKYPMEENTITGYLYDALEKLGIFKENVEIKFFLFGLLLETAGHGNCLSRQADITFNEGNDRRAYEMYSALFRLNRLFNMQVTYNRYPRAEYEFDAHEARMRVAGAFVEDPSILQKVSGTDFHAWSCASMVLQLLASRRASESSRLREVFGGDNPTLCDEICFVTDSDNSDEWKLNKTATVADDIHRAILYMILRMDEKKPYYLKNDSTKKEADRRFRELKPRVIIFANKLFIPKDCNLKESAAVIDLPEEATNDLPPNENIGQNNMSSIPGFIVRALRDNISGDTYSGLSSSDLKRKYEEFDVDDFDGKRRLRFAEYLKLKTDGNDADALNEAALSFGIEEYAYLRSDAINLGVYENVVWDTLFEVVRIATAVQSKKPSSKTYIKYKKNAPDDLLFLLLANGNDLDEFINRYNSNRENYNILAETVASSVERDTYCSIFAKLNDIVEAYENPNAVYEKLLSIREEINTDSLSWFNGWSGQKAQIGNRLQTLIIDKINQLKRVPSLDVKVLNERTGPPIGSLFGIMDNNGEETATDIKIQLTYNNGSLSSVYQLNRLYPNTRATFEVEYVLPPDAEKLNYKLNVSFVHGGVMHPMDHPCEGVLHINERESVNITYTPYYTGTITEYDLDRNGNVYSEELIGRESEKKQLRDLFSRGNFAYYQSATIQGVKRAGKSSLLNYLAAYIKANCGDAFPIIIDCQNISETQCIQDVFVKSVQNEVTKSLPELKETESWLNLTKKWDIPQDNPDRDPNTLEMFYSDLVPLLNGQKLVIILDEVDTLFEKVAHIRGLDSSLFPSLGRMFESSWCKNIVLFIMCGSNELIRYKADGGTLHQMFQKLGGGTRIDIRRMNAQDLRTMMRNPCEKAGFRFDDKALDMLWHFTNGIIWHSKLLGNKLIEYIASQGRNVIYPSDVCRKITDIVKWDYCRQFSEGCKTDELMVLDAMQSRAVTVGTVISKAEIISSVGDRFDVTAVNRALDLLVDLGLIEKLPSERYQFAAELYRLFFRSRSSSQSLSDVEYLFENRDVQSTADNEYEEAKKMMDQKRRGSI